MSVARRASLSAAFLSAFLSASCVRAQPSTLAIPNAAPPQTTFQALVDGPKATLHAELANPVLPAARKQTTWLKIGILGFEAPGQRKRPTANVAIVIDKSGSMTGDKMRHAKEAAALAVDLLAPDDIVSVVAYDHTVQVLVPATRVSDRAAIGRGIARLVPGGNTALFAGVAKGADEVRKFLDRKRVNRVILLSDGLANVGPSSPGELGALAGSLGREGISVTTFGLGLGYNEDLMVQLAARSDGNHAFVEQADDLAGFFRAELGDVLSVVGQEVMVRVEFAPGVRPVRALGRDADIVGQRLTASLNQLYARQEKFLLIELEMPPAPSGVETRVATVDVTYRNAVTRADDRLTATVAGRYSDDVSEVTAQTNGKVMVIAVEALSNETNEQALVLRDQGRVQEAETLLQQNASFLEENAVRYGSTHLQEKKNKVLEDSKNLAPTKWNRRRKAMRRELYKFDSQQSY